MRKQLLIGLLLIGMALGTQAQSALHRMAGDPESITQPQGGIYYFELISEHEGVSLHSKWDYDAEKYDYFATKERGVEVLFPMERNELVTGGEEKPSQRYFTISVDGRKICDYDGKVVPNTEIPEGKKINFFWYIVPVEGNSPYVMIKNRETGKVLSVGANKDGRYPVVLTTERGSNNADQHWKLRLRSKKAGY